MRNTPFRCQRCLKQNAFITSAHAKHISCAQLWSARRKKPYDAVAVSLLGQFAMDDSGVSVEWLWLHDRDTVRAEWQSMAAATIKYGDAATLVLLLHRMWADGQSRAIDSTPSSEDVRAMLPSHTMCAAVASRHAPDENIRIVLKYVRFRCQAQKKKFMKHLFARLEAKNMSFDAHRHYTAIQTMIRREVDSELRSCMADLLTWARTASRYRLATS